MAAPNSPTSESWPSRAAETIEAVVTGVADKTVKPLTTAARGLVFGLVVGIVAQMLLVLLTVGVLRVLDVYAFPGRVWASYTLVGGIFVLAGSFLWSRRRRRTED